MENKQIIQIIKDLISTPEHSDKNYKIISKGNELVEMLETEQLTICGVVNSNGIDKQEVLNNENDIIEEHGCPYQEDVHGDYSFRCNCNDEDTHQCAMDI